MHERRFPHPLPVGEGRVRVLRRGKALRPSPQPSPRGRGRRPTWSCTKRNANWYEASVMRPDPPKWSCQRVGNKAQVFVAEIALRIWNFQHKARKAGRPRVEQVIQVGRASTAGCVDCSVKEVRSLIGPAHLLIPPGDIKLATTAGTGDSLEVCSLVYKLDFVPGNNSRGDTRMTLLEYSERLLYSFLARKVHEGHEMREKRERHTPGGSFSGLSRPF